MSAIRGRPRNAHVLLSPSGSSGWGHKPQVDWWPSLDGFETEDAALKEDTQRLESAECVGLSMFFCDDCACVIPTVPGLKEASLIRLVGRLELPTDPYGGSLASAVCMRLVRQHTIQAIFDAFEGYADDQLATATVIKRTWALKPEHLIKGSASSIKNQFFTDLKRTGVASIPGPLIAFLHGEYDPTAGVFVLHWHIVSTFAKAKALHRLKALRGYTKTHTGAAPIHVTPIGDRVRQVSYLLKSFWPERAVRDGVRDRKGRRIEEPYHTLHLVWLDQQRLRDITIMNGVWSPRKGGTEVMKRLYLKVMG